MNDPAATDGSMAAALPRWKAIWKKQAAQLRRTRRRPSGKNVHALRTSTRRLLAVLDLARAVEGGRKFRVARKKLRRLLSVTSAARDARVQLELFDSLKAPASGHATRPVRRHLQKRAARLEQSLRQKLRSHEHKLRKFGPALLGKISPTADLEPAVKHELRRAQDRIRRRLAAARAGVAGAQHRVRVALKRYRYLLELLPGVAGVGSGTVARLRAAQTKMGELHDLDLCRERIERFAAAHGLSNAWLRRHGRELRSREWKLRARQPGFAPLLHSLTKPARRVL